MWGRILGPLNEGSVFIRLASHAATFVDTAGGQDKTVGMGKRQRKFKPKPCKVCGKLYTPAGCCSKYCELCRPSNAEYCRERRKRTYVKKGYNQRGENNNHWRGGSSPYYYQKVAYAHYGKVCQRCGSEADLVHHKDGDRHNSNVDNLEPLCKRCHQVDAHGCAQNLPQFQSRSKV